MLIKYHASRISLHHNLFAHAEQRNPVVSTDDDGTPAADTTVDIRNNVIWDWGPGVGIMIYKGARANVVANYTASPASGLADRIQGVVVCDFNCSGDLDATSLAAVSGNLSGHALPIDMNAEGNILEPFAAAAVATQEAYAAAQDVLAQAGARPLDALDAQILAGIALPPRPPGPNVSVSFLAVEVGAAGLTIVDRTTNGGTQSAPESSTSFFLSTDASLTSLDIALGSRSVDPLDPDSSSVGSLTVPIPAGIAAGTYVVIAQADRGGQVGEANETDNITARAVSMELPDLIVSVLTVPAATSPGTTISVSSTTRNQSTAAALLGSITRFFLSTDAVLDGGDLPLGNRSVGALAGGASSSGTTPLTIPPETPGGAYHILARADADLQLVELNPANNVTARPIQIGMPDLMVQSLTAPGSGKPGGAIAISDVTRNAGPIASPATTTRYHLSGDVVLDPGDIVLGARAVPAIAPGGQSASGSLSVSIPGSTAPGTYFIVARADAGGSAVELDEGNNLLARPIEIGFDLTIAAIAVPTTATAGATISVSDTTTNLGPGTAPASSTAFFLSPTSTVTASAVMLGSRPVPALAKGAASIATWPVTIPPGVGGDFYVIALANAGAATGLNGNNAKVKAIDIGPDLSVTALANPASASAGVTIAVSDTTRNLAAVAAPSSNTRYFLSTTSALGPGAVLVGTRPIPALAAGVSSAGAATVTIPAGTAPGSYFLIARADGDDAIAEYSEANNTRARSLTVTH
jgi:hypothetical protein